MSDLACPYCAGPMGDGHSGSLHLTPVRLPTIGTAEDFKRINIDEVGNGRPPPKLRVIHSCRAPSCVAAAGRRAAAGPTPGLHGRPLEVAPHTHELVDADGGQRCVVPGCEFSLSSDPVRENPDPLARLAKEPLPRPPWASDTAPRYRK
jgi:hypothetical protein